MKLIFAVTVLVLFTSAVRADELAPLDLRNWRAPAAERPKAWPEPEPVDECAVKTSSALYHQSLVYLAGIRVKSDQSSHYRPFVARVCPGSEAEKAGFREGDVIHSFAVVPLDRSKRATAWEISSVDSVAETLFRFRGQPIETIVIRNEAEIALASFVPRTRERELKREPTSVEE